MAKKKSRKSPKDALQKKKGVPETTLGAVVFYALFSGVLGVFLGFIFFASFSPQVAPDQENIQVAKEAWERRPSLPGDSVYMRPPEGGGMEWRRKVEMLTGGGSADVTLSVAELNNWILSEVALVTPVSGSHNFMMVPRRPAFAVFSDQRVQFTLSVDLHFLGETYPLQFISDGRVDASTARVFEFDRLRCNAAPIPPVPGLREVLIRRFLSSFGEVDGYEQALDVLSRAQSVEAVEGGIRIVI